MDNDTAVRVSGETWQRLNALKTHPGETFDDVIARLLDEHDDVDQ